MSHKLEGKRFGKLTVLERYGSNAHKEIVWKCQCDCGNIAFVTSYYLVKGHTKSCGCYMREQTSKANKTHGETNTKLYRAYSNMMTRCYNPNYKHYDSYGGRGISVCDEWKCQNGYENFSAWAKANGFKEDLTLDRIDVNGNYCPQNCRWTTMKVQQNNRTNNAVYEYNGQRKTMAQWSETLGIKYSRLQTYLREKGYTMDEVVKATFG